MLSAIAKSTKEVVAAKGANGKEEFSCPDCKQTVYPRHRAKWTDHFVHKPHSICKTKLVASLESDEHKLGKQLIVDWLKKNRDSSVEIVKEKTITTVDGRYREIDVAVVKDGKVIEAHECQLSPICIHKEQEGLLDRTIDYYNLNIPVIWWLGRKSNTATVANFLLDVIKKGQKKLPYGHEIGGDGLYLEGYLIECSNSVIKEIVKTEKPMECTKQKEMPRINAVSSEVAKEAAKIVTNTLKSLFKYSNPQTAQTFIKEAIANALDQNPSDATALCAAWEEIEPTLEKTINPTPVLASEVAKENLSFLANGNGRN